MSKIAVTDRNDRFLFKPRATLLEVVVGLLIAKKEIDSSEVNRSSRV